MIQREIISDNLSGRAGEEETISLLLHINAVRADRSRVTGTTSFPMKDLTGIQRAHQIEIRRRNLSQ